MRYAFVAEHRPLFAVRTMCRCLRIHPSGFYAWLKNPLSKRAREDARQTGIIRTAWPDRDHQDGLEGQRQGVRLSQATR